MDVFAVEKRKALKLSVDEFEKQTCHDYLYYRTKTDYTDEDDLRKFMKHNKTE